MSGNPFDIDGDDKEIVDNKTADPYGFKRQDLRNKHSNAQRAFREALAAGKRNDGLIITVINPDSLPMGQRMRAALSGSACPPTLIPNQQPTMRNHHTVSLLQSNYTTVDVAFNNGPQKYRYKVPSSMKLKIGDVVIVPAPSGAPMQVGERAACANVVEVHEQAQLDLDAPYKYKWVIQALDPTAYLRIMDAERALEAALVQAEARRQREQFANDLLKGLAENDPTVLALKESIAAIDAAMSPKGDPK